jgi:hypothetical protein
MRKLSFREGIDGPVAAATEGSGALVASGMPTQHFDALFQGNPLHRPQLWSESIAADKKKPFRHRPHSLVIGARELLYPEVLSRPSLIEKVLDLEDHEMLRRVWDRLSKHVVMAGSFVLHCLSTLESEDDTTPNLVLYPIDPDAPRLVEELITDLGSLFEGVDRDEDGKKSERSEAGDEESDEGDASIYEIYRTPHAITIAHPECYVPRVIIMTRVFLSYTEIFESFDTAIERLLYDGHNVYVSRDSVTSLMRGYFPYEQSRAPSTYWMRMGNLIQLGWRISVLETEVELEVIDPERMTPVEVRSGPIRIVGGASTPLGDSLSQSTPRTIITRPRVYPSWRMTSPPVYHWLEPISRVRVDWPDALDLESIGPLDTPYENETLQFNAFDIPLPSPFYTFHMRTYYNWRMLVEGKAWRVGVLEEVGEDSRGELGVASDRGSRPGEANGGGGKHGMTNEGSRGGGKLETVTEANERRWKPTSLGKIEPYTPEDGRATEIPFTTYLLLSQSPGDRHLLSLLLDGGPLTSDEDLEARIETDLALLSEEELPSISWSLPTLE